MSHSSTLKPESVPQSQKPQTSAIAQSVLELAKQGDTDAISMLINDRVKARRIIATVSQRGNCLYVVLESAEKIDQQRMAKFVYEGITRLQPANIAIIKVIGKRFGQELDWTQTFQILVQERNYSEAMLTLDAAVPSADQIAESGSAQAFPEPASIQIPELESQPISNASASSARTDAPDDRTQQPSSPAVPPFPQNSQPKKFDPAVIGPLAAIITTVVFSLGIIGYFIFSLTQALTTSHSPNPSPVPTPISKPSSPSTRISQATLKPGLNVTRFQLQVSPLSRNLVGTIVNNSSQQYSYVKVEFTLYDQAETEVGEAMAIVGNLGPQKTKEFDAPVIVPKATHAKVKTVVGF